MRQLEVNGPLALDDELKLLTDNIRCLGLCGEHAVNRAETLEMLAYAIFMSWPLVERDESHLNIQDLAFQMQSRLCTVASRM